MKTYKVENYELSGAAIDTFYKLFFVGSQDDGDIPSKSGMDDLINLGLAVKNYKMPEIFPGEKANGLSIKGAKIARYYYRKERDQLRELCGELLEAVKNSSTAVYHESAFQSSAFSEDADWPEWAKKLMDSNHEAITKAERVLGGE